MEFANEISELIKENDLVGIEVVHPTLLEMPLVVEERTLGIRADALYKAYAEISRLRLYRTREGSLLALIAVVEHNSALNARRQLLVQGSLSPTAELQLLDLLQTSHLPKQTKSPQLWSHRLWLLKKFRELVNGDHEFDVVVKAGKNHPRNYYAWSYLRHFDFEHSVQMWDLCQSNLSDVSMWTYLGSIDNGAYKADAEALIEKWGPHESVSAYLRTNRTK